MRNKASHWIEQNKLNIISKDVEYKFHIQSIDAFLKEDFKESYRLARLANKMNKSHDVLRLI